MAGLQMFKDNQKGEEPDLLIAAQEVKVGIS
jgi:hypothetical protein